MKKLIIIGLLFCSYVAWGQVQVQKIGNNITDTVDVAITDASIAVTIADGAILDTVIVKDIVYDASTTSNQITNLTPDYARYTSAEDLLAGGAQNLDSTQFTDVGGEVDVIGYKKIWFYITVDINNSTNVRIKILGKHESAGSEEYPLSNSNVTVFSDNTYTAAAASRYFELDTDADQLLIVEVDVGNACKYLQFQISNATDGASVGQIDAAYVTKGY